MTLHKPADSRMGDLLDLRDGNAQSIYDDSRATSTAQFWAAVDREIASLGEAGPQGGRVHIPIAQSGSQVVALERIVAVLKSGRSALITPEDWTAQARADVRRWCALDYDGADDESDGAIREVRNADLHLDGRADAGSEQEALVLFTSGSTGKPKGVRLSVSALTHNIEAVSNRLDFLGHDQVVASPLSLAHSFGLSTALLSLSRGWGLTMTAKRVPDRQMALAWEESGVTVLTCVPFFLDLIARRRFRLGSDLAPALRALLTAGSGVTDERLARLTGEWRGEICTMYGMTEATARIAIRRYGDGSPVDSVGMPLNDVSVRILGADGFPAPVGTPGRVVVRTPSAMIGYLGDEPTNSAEIVTHDLGHLDQLGHLTIHGRISDVLNFRGNRVHLIGLESAVTALPGIEDCVIVPAVADDDPAAFQIQLSEGVEPADVERAVRDTVRPVGLVGHVMFVEQTSRTASGKVRRAANQVEPKTLGEAGLKEARRAAGPLPLKRPPSAPHDEPGGLIVV